MVETNKKQVQVRSLKKVNINTQKINYANEVAFVGSMCNKSGACSTHTLHAEFFSQNLRIFRYS